MYDQILTRITTADEKDKLTEEINLLLQSLYENKGFGFDSVLRNKIRAWVSAYFQEEFAKEGLDKENYLKNLKEKINNLREVDLVLAYEPSSEMLNTLSGYLREATQENVVLNLNFDPHLIGGVQIIFDGQFRDYSFKRIFEKEFEESRNRILELLQSKK